MKRNLKIPVCALTLSFALLSVGTTNVQAAPLHHDRHTTLISHVIDKIDNSRNNDVDIEDSSLIDASTGDQNTGDTTNGSNSSASENVNKGDGINTNVSTTDIVPVDIDVNIDNSHNTITNTTDSHDTIENNVSYNTTNNYYSSYTNAASYSQKSESTSETVKEYIANKKEKLSSAKAQAAKEQATNNQTTKDTETEPPSATREEKKETTSHQSSNPYVNIFDTRVPLAAEKQCEHSIKLENKNGNAITYCTKCGEIIDSQAAETSNENPLPVAGCLGSIAAIGLALIKRH